MLKWTVSKIKLLFLLILLCLSFLAGRSWQGNKNTVQAQMDTPELDIARMKSDTDYFLSNGANIFLLWLYGGFRDEPFGNDQHSFFAGTPVGEQVCQDILLPSGGRVGVNMHEIGPYPDSQIQKAFDWLQGCGVTYLRTYLSGAGGAEEAQRILNIAADYNLKVILALANPVLGTHMPNYQELASDNYEWYNSGYQTSYKDHAESVVLALRNHPALYGVELANEPHCAAETSALPKYQNWVNNMSSLLRSYGVQVGIGQMASSAASACDSPVLGSPTAFYSTNQAGGITMTSAHYYGTRTLAIAAMSEAKSLGKMFYIGEAGFGEGGDSDSSIPPSSYRPPTKPFPPPYIACDQVYDDTDFHSLRPFQASPCNPEPAISYSMCANDLVATEKIELTWGGGLPIGITQKGDCEEIDGNMVCEFEVNEREIHVDVDLSTAELPIVGLTQGPYVNNSQYRPFGTLTDAQRMNEYLSWYMNGTVYRAEENRPVYYEEYPGKPEEISDEDYETLRQRAGEVINFSGPLNKMLPKDVQTKERLEEIERTEGGDINQDGENKKESDENGPRHNQIVGCLYKLEGYNSFFDAIATVGDFFNFLNNLGPVDYLVPDSFTKGKDVDANPPGPCYPELDENGDMEITSDELDELKVSFGSAIDWLTPDLKVKVETKRLTDWVGELPPLRENYENFSDYWMAYKEWRGDFCLSLGFVYWCFDPGGEDLLPKWPGELFYNIPYSSTEDRVGQISMQSAKTQPPSDLRNQTVSFVPDDEDGTNSKSLFFPHMQETAELGALIQSTYVTGIDTELKNKWLVDSNFIPQNTQSAGYNTNFCEPLESRNPNPGDDLFGDYPENPHLTGNIVYSGEFTCTFPRQETTGGSGADYTCSTPGAVACRLQPEPASDYCREFTCGDDGFWHSSSGDACLKEGCEPIPSISYGNCTVELSTGLSLYTDTPNIEELWERYVNGEMSTFKRIYPKVGEGRPVTEIKDIPADTKISYSSNATETNAGDPNRSRPGTNASLYIPHLGSIYDYFLKGIQKALRPKDAGINLSTIGQSLAPAYNYFESIACPSSTAPPSNIDYREGVLCESTPAECNPNAPIPAGYDGVFKQNVIDLAKRWVETGGENSLVEYCYNTVVSKSLEAQVNPIYTLAIWIQESGASNYNSNITTCDPSRPSQTVQDFGINDPSIAGNFAAQLNRFLRLPYYYPNTYGQCFEDGCNLGTFSRVYQQGASETCSVNNSAISYADKTARTMSSIFNGCQPKYPTDLSCHP